MTKPDYGDYRPTIGIECHVQLKTRTKLFSGASNDARDAEPNTTVSPICFGLPGTLPVLNSEAVTLAVRAGLALNAEIARVSRFDRKHYFYPDLPKGYQTTQMYQPIILAGYVDVPLDNGEQLKVRIHHAHMEEDAGKLTHHHDYSLVDLNRAGTPLIEIVSEPDIHSPQEARAYASELHRLMMYAGVTHGDLYHGNMRFDVNVSVAKKDANVLGTRAEVKNLNSFRSVEKAAEFEIKRQIELLESGQAVAQETRGWNDDRGITTAQRSKEDAPDYRYMPDADIPPIVLEDQEIEAIGAALPKLPAEYRQEFARLDVDSSVVATVLARQLLAELLSQVLTRSESAARRVANWLASNLDDDQELESVARVDDLLELTAMVDASELSSNGASQIFNDLMNGASDPRAIASAKKLLQVSDEGAIETIVNEVLADPASQKAMQDIAAGNDKAIGFLVGQAMKRSRGQANPGMLQTMIRNKLGGN